LYTTTLDGLVENVYSIKLLNMSQDDMFYTIKVEGLEDYKFLGKTELLVGAGEVITVPIRLQIDPGQLKATTTTILFKAQSVDDENIKAESESRFIGPLTR